MRLFSASLLLVLIFVVDLASQIPQRSEARSTRGRDFYITFMPNVHDAQPRRTSIINDSLSIYITSDVPTSGVIHYRNRAGREFTQNFQIADPAQVFRFRVHYQDFELQGFYMGRTANQRDYDFTNAQSERIARQSFRITANNDVTVYGLNQALYTSDAFLTLPTTSLGTDYVVLSYKSDATGERFSETAPNEISTPSQFAVVATQNDTEVRIRPSAPTALARNTNPQTVRLNQGDVYLVQADPRSGDGFADLTGSRVSANKPIAIFAGHQRTTLPVELRLTPLRTRDHLVEQIPGLETWGKSAFLTPFVRARGEVEAGNDRFRVLAAFDSTRVFFNGQLVRTLNAGEYFEENLINPGLLTASDQILVAQYKKTSSTTDGNDFRGDPFMLIVPNVEQYDNSYRIVNVQAFDEGNLPASTGGQVFDQHFVTIIAPNTALDNVRFDEQLVARNAFAAIPNTGYSFANITTNAGTHTARSDSAFGIYVYGYGILNSYGYVGGGKLRIIAPDRNAPLLVFQDTCFGVRGVVFDTLLTDSRIASVQAVDVQNMNVNIQAFQPFADSVQFSGYLQNTLLDGSFTLIARDSAGLITRRTFFVRGTTVAVEGHGANPGAPEQRFTVDLGRSRIFRIPIVNYGATTQTVSSIQLINDQQTPQLTLRAPGFPLTLQPGERDTVLISFESTQIGTFSATLNFITACQTRTIARIVVEAGEDVNAPASERTLDYCARTIALRFTDAEPFPSGIRSLEPIGALVNCTLQIEPIRNSLDVRAVLSILNPRRDALYTIQIIDSAGNRTVISDTVQGFTIELQQNSAEASPPGVFGDVQITGYQCEEILYRNVGIKPFVIQHVSPVRNMYFSLPPHQFPIIIPPGATRGIRVCFAPLMQQQYRDTLFLEEFCVRDVLPLFGTGTPLIRLNPSRCDVDIRLTTNTAPLNYFMEQNYPNPASSFTTIRFGVTETTVVKFSLYNSLGMLIDTLVNASLPEGTHELQVDISTLENGLYFYELHTSSGQHMVKQLYVLH